MVTRFIGAKMKLVITGGNGFIGKWVLSMLPDNINAVVTSRNLDGIINVNNREFHCYTTDYKYESLCEILSGNDAVLHLAAKRPTESIQSECMQNAIVDFELFHACEKCNISNIVFLSSRSVYGRQKIPWTENSNPTPLNSYALAKLQSEQTAEFFNNRGLFIKSLRISQVMGLGEKDENVITVFIKNAVDKKPLTLTGGGNIKREYIYVKDLVDSLLLALSKPSIRGVYNLGSGCTVSIEELANLINYYFDNVGNLRYSDTFKIINEHSLMDSSLFYSEFKWAPKWTIENALQDMKNILCKMKDV